MRKVWVETLNELGEPQGRQYCFLCNFRPKIGEIVLCDTSRGLMLGEVIPFVQPWETVSRRIIGRVDMSEFLGGLARERELESIENQMQARFNQLHRRDALEQLAKVDPIMHGLLRRYNSLTGR